MHEHRPKMTALPRNDLLTFSEEILILVLNDERGVLTSIPRTNVECALAGAVLMDLAFADRIDTGLKTLFVVDRTPTHNPLLDPVLAKIAGREETVDARVWLQVLATEDAGRIRDRALVRLARRGLLERRDGSFDWAFAPLPPLPSSRRRGFTGSAGARGRRRAGRRIGQRIREALLLEEIPEPRDAALIGLVEACDLLGAVVPDGYLDRLRPRVVQLRRMDLIGRELARVIADVERGISETLAAASPGPRPDAAGADGSC